MSWIKNPFVFTGSVASFPLLANPKGEVARTDRGDQARPGSACSSASRRPRVEKGAWATGHERRRSVKGDRGTLRGFGGLRGSFEGTSRRKALGL